jgi:membrane protease YdiL (CAAX protease family)
VISEKPWSADAVLRLGLGIIMTVCFGLCLANLLKGDFARMGVTSIVIEGGVLGCIWFFLREARVSWKEAFGLETPQRAKAAAWGAAGALLFLPVAWGMQDLLGHLIKLATHHEAEKQELVKVLQRAEFPWGQEAFMGVVAVFIAPVAEEMLFRGIIYPTIKQSGFPRAAWWVTSLLFAGAHVNWLSFIPLAVFSMVLIYLYEKTGCLWASMTAHGVFNLANFVFLVYLSWHHPILLPAQ